MSARKVLDKSDSFTRIHAMNSKVGTPLKDINGTQITVIAVGIVEDVDSQTGEIKKVGVIVSQENEIFSTISSNAVETLEELIDMFNDEHMKKCVITVKVRTSKGGRDFLSLIISEAEF